MKLLLSIAVLVILLQTISSFQDASELEDMANQIADKLRADLNGQLLKSIEWRPRAPNSNSQYYYLYMDIYRLTGFSNVKLTVTEWGRARSLHGPDFFKGTLTGGPITIEGNVSWYDSW